MSTKKRADLLEAGESFEPLQFTVTDEFNETYLHAEEDVRPRYMDGPDGGLVHPSLLINRSQHMLSPSFYLEPGMAAVLTHNEVHFKSPGRVGRTFTVTFDVVDTYERRGRPYQVVESMIVDDTGTEVMHRKTTYTHVGGPFPGGKES
ncbi:MAG: hypothetical protein IH956_03220 [Chloroflexi bacterium]|nr:hypothetical protein [Chloroflexota bacterium]